MWQGFEGPDRLQTPDSQVTSHVHWGSTPEGNNNV